jgi:hypothetical protein
MPASTSPPGGRVIPRAGAPSAEAAGPAGECLAQLFKHMEGGSRPEPAQAAPQPRATVWSTSKPSNTG